MWVINATLRPLYHRERDPVSTVQNAGWAPGQIWTGAKNLAPTGIFFSFLPPSALELYFFVLIVMALTFVLYCTTHNTNIHTPRSIQTRNPSKRSAADPRLRPLGCWDRLRSQDRPARCKSLYRLSRPDSG